MNPRLRTVLIVVAPVLAVTGFALGMRYGASSAAVYVDVLQSRSVGPGHPVYLQFATMLRESGVDERAPGQSIHVEVGTPETTIARDVTSNEDAVAVLAVPWAVGQNSWLVRVRSLLPGGVLTEQRLTLEAQSTSADGAALVATKPAKSEGDLASAVVVPGAGLPVGFPSDVVVKVGPLPTGVPFPELVVTPEPGMEVLHDATQRCPAEGLFLLRVLPQFAVVGFHLEFASSGKVGEWFGALPTFPGVGAFDLPLARVIAADKEFPITVSVPSPKRAMYMEVVSSRGQWFLQELRDVRNDQQVMIPPLPEGDYVAVLANHFLARDRTNSRMQPFHVGAGNACARAVAALGPTFEANLSPQVVLPGVALANTEHRNRRIRGYAIGFSSLALGLVALTVLVLGALRESTRKLALLSADAELSTQRLATSGNGGAIVSLLLALLAFAVLAFVAFAKGLTN
jgi:hypothetical protein